MSDESDHGRVRVAVDRELCFGFGYCADLLPEVFVVDPTGRSALLATEADAVLAAEAVAACPRSAISAMPATPLEDVERASS